MFLTALQAWFPQWLSNMKEVLGQSLIGAFHTDLDMTTLPGILWSLAQRAVVPLSALAALTFVATLALHLAITQMGLSLQKLTPDLTRLNPATKIKQMASQAPSAVMQAALMLVVFGCTIYIIAKQNAELFLSLPFTSLEIGLQKAGIAMKDLLWKGAAVFLVFGLFDLFRQKRRFTKDLRMSKQDVRQENKESETNPHVKGKIRRMRRDLARRRMMAEVRTATALIVNPTHYAVALRYGFDSSADAGCRREGQELSGSSHPRDRQGERRAAGRKSTARAGPLQIGGCRPRDSAASLSRRRRGARLHLQADPDAQPRATQEPHLAPGAVALTSSASTSRPWWGRRSCRLPFSNVGGRLSRDHEGRDESGVRKR